MMRIKPRIPARAKAAIVPLGNDVLVPELGVGVGVGVISGSLSNHG